MNTEHETLSRNLEDLKQKITETHRMVMSLEVSVTNRAAAAEEALDVYTGLLSSVGLFPPLPPPLQDVDLTLELNTAASNPAMLLSGADIRKVIKPTLSKEAEAKRAERAKVESERIKVDNELDQLTLECENMEEEIAQVEKKVMALNEQADDLREVSDSLYIFGDVVNVHVSQAAQQDAIVSNSEAMRLERELALAKNAALANGMGVKARLQAVQFEFVVVFL
jgi:kinetochore protein NDC80